MKTCITFAIAKANKANAKAQMAELVDALVSNTSGVTSMPVRSRLCPKVEAETLGLRYCDVWIFTRVIRFCRTSVRKWANASMRICNRKL